MSRTHRPIVSCALSLLALAGCATAPSHWNASGGSRDAGVVRVSYEYSEAHPPTLTDLQAEKLALNRCESWGYQRAEPVPGLIRECSATDGGSCELWKVTREFQCNHGEDASYAARLSR